MAAMISAGEVGPGTELLINDAGRYVLRAGGHEFEIEEGALAGAIRRTRPVAVLVASSKSPISRISPPVERALARFGCEVERP